MNRKNYSASTQGNFHGFPRVLVHSCTDSVHGCTFLGSPVHHQRFIREPLEQQIRSTRRSTREVHKPLAFARGPYFFSSFITQTASSQDSRLCWKSRSDSRTSVEPSSLPQSEVPVLRREGLHGGTDLPLAALSWRLQRLPRRRHGRLP